MKPPSRQEQPTLGRQVLDRDTTSATTEPSRSTRMDTRSKLSSGKNRKILPRLAASERTVTACWGALWPCDGSELLL